MYPRGGNRSFINGDCGTSPSPPPRYPFDCFPALTFLGLTLSLLYPMTSACTPIPQALVQVVGFQDGLGVAKAEDVVGDAGSAKLIPTPPKTPSKTMQFEDIDETLLEVWPCYHPAWWVGWKPAAQTMPSPPLTKQGGESH